MRKVINLKGRKFGKLTVIDRVENNKKCQSRWICKCDCGLLKEIDGSHLREGHTKSCGCLRKEVPSKLFKKHNLSHAPIYNVWANFKSRCYNKKDSGYKDYGERKIKVCDEWKNDFIAFKEWAVKNGYEAGLTIDRIDNNGDYSPHNCRFVTCKENQRNTSRSRIWHIKGLIFNSAQEAGDYFNVSSTSIYHWCNQKKKDCYSVKKYHNTSKEG